MISFYLYFMCFDNLMIFFSSDFQKGLRGGVDSVFCISVYLRNVTPLDRSLRRSSDMRTAYCFTLNSQTASFLFLFAVDFSHKPSQIKVNFYLTFCWYGRVPGSSSNILSYIPFTQFYKVSFSLPFSQSLYFLSVLLSF